MPFKWKSKYSCYYCDKMYTEYAKLKKHTKSHSTCTLKTLKRAKSHEIKVDVSDISCELCQMEFKSVTDIIDHLIHNHDKMYHQSIGDWITFREYRLCDLRCVHCSKQFDSFKDLARHDFSAHDSFECRHCRLLFTKADLALHIRTHKSPFFCLKCGKNFIDEAQLKSHRESHLHHCSHCEEKFKSAANLKIHKKKEHSDRGCTKCDCCFKEFSSTSEMTLHLSSCDAKSQIRDIKEDTLPSNKRNNRNTLCNQIRRNIQCVLNMSTAVPFKFKGNFSCFYCSHWLSDFAELIVHTKTEHPVCDLKSNAMRMCKGEKACIKLDIKGLACKLCSQPFSELSSFVDHAIAEHGADYEKSVPLRACFEAFHLIQGRIPCPECKEPFAYFATLLKHLGSEHNHHHKAVCAYCGRGFRTTTSLAMHISNSHTGMCECSICSTKCKNSQSLARHMARYHDVKNFKCSQCPEQFETIYKKQNHLIKAHNIGHKCAYCGKMFTRNSFMVNHVRRTHLKERTVPCSVCHVKFFDTYHMRLHMVKHEGMRKFRCDVCGKTFLRVRNLKSHMDTHKKGYSQDGV